MFVNFIFFLARFEQQNSHLSKIEVDKMFGFMGDIASEIPANDTVPRGVVLFIEFFLDISGNVFLDVVFFKCLCGTIYGILLHVFTHIRIFYHSLSVTTTILLLGHIYCNKNIKETFHRHSLDFSVS